MPTRVLRPHQRHGYGPLAIVLLIGAIAWSSLVIYAFRHSSNERDQLCLVLSSLISRSGATLGQPGSPGYAYYRDHPVELSAARRQNAAYLTALPCSTPTKGQ